MCFEVLSRATRSESCLFAVLLRFTMFSGSRLQIWFEIHTRVIGNPKADACVAAVLRVHTGSDGAGGGGSGCGSGEICL